MLWGDVVYELEAAGEAISTVLRAEIEPKTPELESEPYYGEIVRTPEEEYLLDWEMPDLNEIPAIWRHFPVNVVPIAGTDGQERYSLVWHRKNLTEWREYKCVNWDEFLAYQDYQEFRLKYSLENTPEMYEVLPARNEDEICVIRLVRPSGFVAHAPTKIHAPIARAAQPQQRALDVLRLAPVSWDRDGATHYIKIHNKKIAQMAADQRKNVTEVTKVATADLLDALSKCGDCVVKRAQGYLCVVELK